MSLDDLLPLVSRPSRYLGGETGSVRKDPATVDLTLALAFPDVYEVGMSHLGLAILYRVVNGLEWAAAERAFAPWPDLEEELRRSGTPLASLESERPLHAFDVVGFTLQYELSYTNLLNMLDLGGIPRRADERGASAPLVIAGGPCAYNPEPLSAFIDAFVIGDAEEALVELCEAVRRARSAGLSRPALLEELAALEGIYVPAHFEPRYLPDGRLEEIRPRFPKRPTVRRRFLADLDAAPFPEQPVIPFMQTVHDRVALEVARGCTRGCRFCQAGYIYRPVRERSPQRILELAERALGRSGYEELSLLSLSTGDYGCIGPLLAALMKRHADDRIAVSLPSLRVGTLTPELMEEIRKVRKTGFTLAPEAGTERLRRVINKGIGEEELLAATRQAFDLGWRVVKLYFMLGLPTETDEDLEAIAELSARVKRGGRGSQGGADVNVSVSTFVPKPHTPFQWEAQIGLEETRRRQERLRGELRRRKLRMKWHDPELSFLEGVFARGDRRLGRVLEAAVERGCRFDGWREHFDFPAWRQAFADCGIDPEAYLRARREDEILPWAHIDCGVDPAYLRRERQRAFREEPTDDCRLGRCTGCGLCDDRELRPRLWKPDPAPAASPSSEQSAAPPGPADRHRVRLQMAKRGKARFVGHLEFMSLLHRAVRRARLPIRFSEGFHPAPRISFGDALPTGIESEAEIMDLELSRPLEGSEVAAALNRQLPEGFRVLEAWRIDWPTPSPSASIRESIYRVELPASSPPDLPSRLAAFLDAERVETRRLRKGREQTMDLRPSVSDLAMEQDGLRLVLRRGSPLPVAAHLLGISPEEARFLRIEKYAIVFA